VDTEAQIVKAVFPNPSIVMQVFLQRVFAQSVRNSSIIAEQKALFWSDTTTHGTVTS
jgi:hypothetical protein